MLNQFIRSQPLDQAKYLHMKSSCFSSFLAVQRMGHHAFGIIESLVKLGGLPLLLLLAIFLNFSVPIWEVGSLWVLFSLTIPIGLFLVAARNSLCGINELVGPLSFWNRGVCYFLL